MTFLFPIRAKSEIIPIEPIAYRGFLIQQRVKTTHKENERVEEYINGFDLTRTFTIPLTWSSGDKSFIMFPAVLSNVFYSVKRAQEHIDFLWWSFEHYPFWCPATEREVKKAKELGLYHRQEGGLDSLTSVDREVIFMNCQLIETGMIL